MKFLLPCLAFGALAGCAQIDDLFDSLSGIKHNVVVLQPTALELSETPNTFMTSPAAEVIGTNSAVCVVLAGNVAHNQSEAEVQKILNGAKLRALVHTNDGRDHELKCFSTYDWRLYGKILPDSELATCARPNCAKETMPIGSKVESITISSSAPVHALGIYWDSSNDRDRGN